MATFSQKLRSDSKTCKERLKMPNVNEFNEILGNLKDI
jgi:hypothetical protein